MFCSFPAHPFVLRARVQAVKRGVRRSLNSRKTLVHSGLWKKYSTRLWDQRLILASVKHRFPLPEKSFFISLTHIPHSNSSKKKVCTHLHTLLPLAHSQVNRMKNKQLVNNLSTQSHWRKMVGGFFREHRFETHLCCFQNGTNFTPITITDDDKRKGMKTATILQHRQPRISNSDPSRTPSAWWQDQRRTKKSSEYTRIKRWRVDMWRKGGRKNQSQKERGGKSGCGTTTTTATGDDPWWKLGCPRRQIAFIFSDGEMSGYAVVRLRCHIES